jgi:hypothetical protein
VRGEVGTVDDVVRAGEIDVVTAGVVAELARYRAHACVSIFLPTHPAGSETRQDPIRLANLVRSAAGALTEEQGLSRSEADELLSPVVRLLDDREFWRYQSEGLAVYVAPGWFRKVRVPLPLTEEVFVGIAFRLRPLLGLVAGDGRFFVLALSQNEVRLFEGTRFTLAELPLGPIPASMADALAHEDREAHLQVRSGGQAGMFHGHGTGDEVDKQALERYFRAVDRGLSARLGSDRHPLVLAAVSYYLPIYQSVTTHEPILDDCIAGNPEGKPPRDLHQRGWEIVAPVFASARLAAEERLARAIAGGRAAVGAAEVVTAALAGRIATLFLATDHPCWGRSSGLRTVETHEVRRPGDEDLLDTAAGAVLGAGGRVFTDAADAVAVKAPAAAELRW